MKIVSLTQGYETIIDDEDYKRISIYNWYIRFGKQGEPRVVYGHISMSRLIMNASDDLEVDHRDGNTLDHRKQNLRLCTHIQNCQNSKKTKKKTSSIYKGVCSSHRKWRAEIRILDNFNKGASINLGHFLVEEDAAKAYDQAARYYYKEFAALNFPEKGEQSCL